MKRLDIHYQNNQMSKKHDIEEKFTKANLSRHELSEIPRSFQELIFFMDYKIRKDIKSFTLLSICGGDRNNFVVDPNFQRAFNTLTLAEKVDYYALSIDYGLKACMNNLKGDEDEKKSLDGEQIQGEANEEKLAFYIKIFKGISSWEETQVEVNGFKVMSRAKNPMNIDLRNYLMRRSKKKNMRCYVLEAIRSEGPETLRFGFKSQKDEKKYLPIITQKINLGLELSISQQILDINIKRMMNERAMSKKLKLKASTRMVQESEPDEEKEQPEIKISRTKKAEEVEDQIDFMPVDSLACTSRIRDNKSICEEMVKSMDQQELDDELTEIIAKQDYEQQQRNKLNVQMNTNQRNIFRIFLPHYQLEDLPYLIHYKSVYQSPLSEFYIYQSTIDPLIYKIQFTTNLDIEIACKAIYNMHLYKYWHPEISEAQVKLKISSENSCLTYQQLKPYSEWYRARDFLTLLHLFKEANCYYIVGKSIENTNYIPLQSVTRGNIDHMVWKIKEEPPKQGESQSLVMMEIKISHGGLLNKSHQKEQTERYLKGFEFMGRFFSDVGNQNKMTNYMGMNWTNYEQTNRTDRHHRNSFNSLKTCDFQSGSDISSEEEQTSQQQFYSIQNLSGEDEDYFTDGYAQRVEQQSKLDGKMSKKKEKTKEVVEMIEVQSEEMSEHELDEEVLRQTQIKEGLLHQSKIFGEVEDIKVNNEDVVILPQKYLKKKYVMNTFEAESRKIVVPFGKIVERDIWELQKNGGLKMVNKQKIQAQNNVLGYIMKTLKKNLFSGKGVLNISLPVDIFNNVSNLQRVCECMTFGPQFLEKAVKASALDRFKWVLAFGLSNSIIYFDVEKPFNPILGQTYQGYIKGCPVYAQQISHHPPISCVYFVGRGYKVTVSLESKVNIRVNSGDGINQGFFHVIFDDGQQILFQTPPGELSGLAMGDRRFNLQGKGLYIDPDNQLYCEMKFVDDSGFFSKKKRAFADEISGDIVKVTHSFVTKFMAASDDKKPSPDKTEIVETICEISGRWPINLNVAGQCYYNVRQSIPEKMLDELYPLNSNSNYREDIFFKKLNDLPKSQIQKQRLEVLQRNDRKLRQKFSGKKGH